MYGIRQNIADERFRTREFRQIRVQLMRRADHDEIGVRAIAHERSSWNRNSLPREIALEASMEKGPQDKGPLGIAGGRLQRTVRSHATGVLGGQPALRG